MKGGVLRAGEVAEMGTEAREEKNIQKGNRKEAQVAKNQRNGSDVALYGLREGVCSCFCDDGVGSLWRRNPWFPGGRR